MLRAGNDRLDSEETMKYRCKHTVEALPWFDTDENRERFAAWFESHYAMFETCGSVVVLSDGYLVKEGEWVVYMDDEFIGMDYLTFDETYTRVDEINQDTDF